MEKEKSQIFHLLFQIDETLIPVHYIAKIISKIVLLGALLLSVVALFPILYSQITTLICVNGLGLDQGVSISLGGTSIIILVGVALETVRQLESQMMMRHYKGFLD